MIKRGDFVMDRRGCPIEVAHVVTMIWTAGPGHKIAAPTVIPVWKPWERDQTMRIRASELTEIDQGPFAKPKPPPPKPPRMVQITIDANRLEQWQQDIQRVRVGAPETASEAIGALLVLGKILADGMAPALPRTESE